MELPVIYNHHQRSVCNSDLSQLSLGFFYDDEPVLIHDISERPIMLALFTK